MGLNPEEMGDMEQADVSVLDELDDFKQFGQIKYVACKFQISFEQVSY